MTFRTESAISRLVISLILLLLTTLLHFSVLHAQDYPRKISGDCEDHEITNSPSDSDGDIVKTEDGHIYEIDEVDRVDSQLWLSGDDILVCWSRYIYKGRPVTIYTIRNGSDKDDATLLH